MTIIEEQAAEIERLEAERDALSAELAAEREVNQTNQAAIERFCQHESELRAQVEEAREALEPFAKRAAYYDPVEADDPVEAEVSRLTLGSLRHARAVLEKIKGGGDE